MAIDCVDAIPGAPDLVAWYGGVPSFHDAYVTGFGIDAAGVGHVRLRAFRMTDKLNEQGHYVLDQHFVATFHFSDVFCANLAGFAPGRPVLMGLNICKIEQGFRLELDPVYGMSAEIEAKYLRVTFEPVEWDGVWPPT